MDTPLEQQLQDAIELANEAKAHFQEKPVMRSKRGGDTLSPWFRVWDAATQNAVRLHRALRASGKVSETLEDELEKLTHAKV